MHIMENETMKFTRALSASFLLFALACGGGSGGGSSVTVPGDESAPFNESSSDDMMEVCEDFNATKSAVIMANQDAMCLGMGIGQAMDNRTANDEIGPDFDWSAAAAACKGFQTECKDMMSSMGVNLFDEDCAEKAEDWVECTATNGEVQACINSEIAMVKQGVSALKGETCDSMLSMEGVSNFMSLIDSNPSNDPCDDLPWECDV